MFYCHREIKTYVINLSKRNTIRIMPVEFSERKVECFESHINNVADNYLREVYCLWWEAVEMISLNRCCVTVTSVQCLKTIPICRTHSLPPCNLSFDNVR